MFITGGPGTVTKLCAGPLAFGGCTFLPFSLGPGERGKVKDMTVCPRAGSEYVYYCRTYEKAVSGGGEREKGGHATKTS